ncbi:MAG: FdhF/YdeP family oxidoreductase [Bacteroidota bacterium]|nr:FdhF/YdeP family oxidoreductase [Bacteroidota bacterium]MDX5430753.1 FdhF/YdeP family oxidoreductase [Bacteroidota bacterium]MDX5469498.1 FdhF/YdeP family oxidoreductase [Bacteroidota bacterium]
MKKRRFPNPENPETFTGIKLGAPKKAAAGMPAVFSSIQHVFGEMDVPRGLKALLKVNQKDGFDCPGCAWPDPDDERSSIAEYCENGAKAIAEEATSKSLKPDFFARYSVEEMAEWSDYEIGKKGRIAQPMYLAKGDTHYRPVSWDTTFQILADHLHALDHPDEAVFYTSGRTSNEAAFLYQLFVREFGTNNLPDCSNMCHESSGVALNESLGIGKGSVKLEDFYESEVIIIIGQNPGTNHPRMLSALQKAKENGAQIISINPLPETGLIGFSNPQTLKGALGIKARLTDLFLQVKINGDMALLKALEKKLLEFEEEEPGSVLDHDFIEQHTRGFQELKQNLTQYDYQELERISGIDEYQLQAFADILRYKKKIIACWAMGLTQHKNAVDTIKEVVNVLLMKGSIGKPGAGTCPVRGHSNVQGDRTMGIYEKPGKAFLDKLDEVFGIQSPREHGLDVVDSIVAMHEGRAKVFFAMGGNFLSATPDTTYTAEALRNCKLTAHVSTKLNRSHLVHGEEALILPCLGRSDKDFLNGELQFISCENSMGVIQQSKGSLKPISDKLLSEPMIVCLMAMATLGKTSKVDWMKYVEHYDRIREDIEKTIPGFTNYNERVRLPGGFYLPNSARDGSFRTLSGKAEFNAGILEEFPIADDEYRMMTIRSHDQFNTTIYGLDDRYRGISNERRVIFMNTEDMKKEGLEKGDIVDLYNYFGGVERVAHRFIVIPFSIPKGCTATYFPETNVLVPIDSVAEKSNTPTSKMIALKIKKSQEEAIVL